MNILNSLKKNIFFNKKNMKKINYNFIENIDYNVELTQYQKKILSQYGQDGILNKIFDILGITNKYFVEFGSNANDDGEGNTANLRKRGFNGLLMDKTDKPYSIFCPNKIYEKKYEIEYEFITAKNINNIFEKYNVPNEFDLLSIDIDGQEFHVWNNLSPKYRPRVVIIAINNIFPPGVDRVMDFDENWSWKGDEFFGSSISAMKNLGLKKGYSLVSICCSDLIFIRLDLTYRENKCIFRHMNDEWALYRLNADIHKFTSNELNESDFFKKSTDFI